MLLISKSTQGAYVHQRRKIEPRRLTQSLYSNHHRKAFDLRHLEESKLFRKDLEDSRRTSKETKNFGPKVWAQYHLQKKIPVLGKQTFQLRILQENVAELLINGMLEVKDVIHYTVDERSGEFSFTLSERTNMILKRFRTKLLAATYCPKTDRSSIIVQPPLPMKLSLHLNRLLWINAHKKLTFNRCT